MNRIYRLVWNRTLRALQVASEFARSPRSGSVIHVDSRPALRRQPLAHACAMALALGLVVTSAPALAGTNGGNGGTGSNSYSGTGGTAGTGSTPGTNSGGTGGSNYSNGGTGGGAAGSGGTGGGGKYSASAGAGGTSTGGGRGGNGVRGSWTTGGGGGAGGGLSTLGLGGGGGGGGAYHGGGGGGGGAGLGFSFSSNSTNASSISGGNGGNGGGISDGQSSGGGGGGGGAGALIGAGYALINGSAISGGNGGAGTVSGAGGGGGAGVLMDIGASLTNSGSISGGNGGGGSNAGAGGAGLFAGGNTTITNSGTISGGLTGGSGAQANAIEFDGTGNTLNVQTGSTINGDLELDAGAGVTIANLNSGLTLGNAIKLDSSASALTFNAVYDDFTVSGVISGSGSVNVVYRSLLHFTNTNTYSGGTTIASQAFLELGDGGTTGSVAGNITDNGALAFNRSDAVTFGNVISGSGNLIQAGSGTLILTGANNYTGTTMINAGTLQVGNGGVAGSLGTGGISNNANLSFDLSANTTVANAISGAGQINNNGTGLITLSTASTDTSTLTLNGGTAGILVTGGLLAGSGFSYSFQGNVTLAGTSGSTRVYSSSASNTTLTFLSDVSTWWVGSATLANAPNIVVGSGFTVSEGSGQSAANVYYNSLSGAGTLALAGSGSVANVLGTSTVQNLSMAGGQLLIGNGGASGQLLSGNVSTSNGLVLDSTSDYTYTGIYSGSGGLTQQGTGTVSLTGANTYTGGTTISAGTLQISNGGTTGSIIGNVTNNSAIAFDRSDAVTFGNVISGSGSLRQAGSGTLILTGANTYTGGTTVSAGTLQIGNGGTSGSITGDVTNNSTLAFNRTDDVTFGNAIGGSGSLSQAGSGTLTLTGANTYTGGTTISVGNLLIGDGGTSGAITGDVVNNGILGFNRSDAVTFGNVISGSGALITIGNSTQSQLGSGSLTLTGTNTYTGLTVIYGTLALTGTGSIADSSSVLDNGIFDISNTGSGATITSLSGADTATVLLGNQSLTLSQAADTFSGAITGNGGLTLAAGTEVLSGANTYTGDTTISAGTLQIGSGGTSGSITGNVTNNGTLAFDRSDAVSFGNVISGSGSVSKIGSGTLTLNGANSYTGGTTLTTGTLSLGNASAIGTGTLAMAEFTALDFTSSFTLANAITLSGDPTFNVGSGLTTTLSGGISDGTQSGDLVKTGAGSLILTGVDTYTGSTEVAAGTLDVQGSIVSAVSVDSGATLTGTGSIGGMTIASGATLNPGGNAIGTLTVNGNVSIASGASYQVNATDTGSSDLIHATGTATLGGGSVVALAAGTHWAASTRYTIVTADSGVSGSFGTASSNFAFLAPTLSYDASHAYLTLARNTTTFPSVGITANQVHTAAAVEALGSSSAVYNAVLPLAAGPARAAFNTLAGDSLASTRTAIVDDSHYVRDAISNHLQGVQGSGDVSRQTDEGSVWTSAWGHGGSHDSNGNASSLSSSGSGMLLGADRNLGNWRLGAVAGVGQLSASTDAGADAHSTSTHLGLYSALDLGAWQLQGGVAQSAYQTQSRRHIDVAGITSVASARYDNRVTQAFVDGGYRFQWAQGSVTPYVNLAQVWMHQDAINEAGNAGALAVQADGSHVSYGTAGVRGVFASTAVTQLYANVGLQHAWGNLASINQQTFAVSGTGSFSVAGLPVAQNAGIVDFGAHFSVAPNVWIDAGYHGQFASHATDQGARMSLNVNF